MLRKKCIEIYQKIMIWLFENKVHFKTTKSSLLYIWCIYVAIFYMDVFLIQIDNFNLMNFFSIVKILWHVNAWHSTKHCSVMQKMIHLMIQQPYACMAFCILQIELSHALFYSCFDKGFFCKQLLILLGNSFLKVASKFCIERLKQLYPPQWRAINFIALHFFATFGQIYV
jgi:hypothetical protein